MIIAPNADATDHKGEAEAKPRGGSRTRPECVVHHEQHVHYKVQQGRVHETSRLEICLVVEACAKERQVQ